MRAKSVVRALAAIALAMLPSAAWAGYCGVARYNGCTPCCYQQHCHTVMKTVRCVEWQKQQVTRCKTVYDRVCEDRVINCTRYVHEQRQKEVCYTVCKPVWETKTRCYTVCKPVWETKTRNVCYTTYHPVWETKQRCYTVCKPVWETKSRDVCYTTYHPVWETKTTLLHRLQAGLGNQDSVLHGAEARLGNAYSGNPLHHLQNGLGDSPTRIYGAKARLGNS